MYSNLFLIKANIKRQKADIVVFITLVMLSTMLMLVSLSMIFTMGKVVDSHFKDINGAEVVISLNERAKNVTQEVVKKDKRIKDYEAVKRLLANAKYKEKSDKQWSDFTFAIQSYKEKRTINKVYKFPNSYEKNDALLPYYLHGHYKIGSTIQLKINENKYNFRVAGYTQDPMYSTPLNVTVYNIYVSEDMMKKMAKNQEVASQVKYNIILKNKYYKDKVEDDISDKINKKTGSVVDGQKISIEAIGWYSGMKGGCMFMPKLALAVLFIFSIMVLVISAIVISFAIRNFIEKNMRDIGLLMASGYKISKLRQIIVSEIGLVTLVGTIIGVIFGKLLYSNAGRLMEDVLGLEWNQGLDVKNVFIIAFAIFVFSCVIAYGGSRRFKKITVLTALRGGINTHSYKKNYFPLITTRLPINLTLSLKNVFSSGKKAIGMFVMMAIMAIIMQTAYGIYYNFGNNQERILEFAGTEGGTIGVYGDESLKDKLEKIPHVKAMHGRYGNVSCFFQSTQEEQKKGKSKVSSNANCQKNRKGSIVSTFIFQDLSKLRYCNIVEGRISKYENEIIIGGGVAEDLEIKAGDTIEVALTRESPKKTFIVTGIYQQINNMGRTVMMNKNAYERLNPDETKWKEEVLYTIYAADGKNYQDMRKEVLKVYPEGKNKIDNYEKMAAETTDVVSNVLIKLSIVISIITAFIVMFVEGLLIHSKVVMEWKNLGLNKALGFTSKKLILQMVMSNVPIIFVGSLFGVVVSKSLACQFLTMGMSSFGMKSVKMEFGIGGMILTMAIIIFCAILSAVALSIRIRKANPVDMLVKYGES